VRLLLDLGNTRLKWAITDEHGHFLDFGVVEYIALNSFLSGQFFNQTPSIEQVWIASVNDSQYDVRIDDYFSKTAKVYHVYSPTHRCGVTNSYQEPLNLGIDRWLGMVAAHYYIEAPVLIIDAGTAMTADCIDEKGQHLGGFIVPGMNMMRQSLSNNTAQLPSVSKGKKGLGCSTHDAIANGTFEMLIGLVERTLQQQKAQYPNMQCIITGGDAQLLYNALSVPVQYEPHWVLKGLWVESDQSGLSEHVASGRTNEK